MKTKVSEEDYMSEKDYMSEEDYMRIQNMRIQNRCSRILTEMIEIARGLHKAKLISKERLDTLEKCLESQQKIPPKKQCS